MKLFARPTKLSQGSTYFLSPEPCNYGHAPWRYVSDRTCVECSRISVKKWRQANPDKLKAQRAKRRAAKLSAIPPWADLKAIQKFYEECPEGYHVDHYYPLQGRTVSGLHVLENLKHIPAAENQAKHNKMPEEFYSTSP